MPSAEAFKEGKYLQITAPISHGSSGGPLFNMTGEVVGITAAFLEGGENLNFAIPINEAKLLLQNRSATLQSPPDEAPPVAQPVAKTEPEEKIWTTDLFGGEYKIKAEPSEIRITTIRPPNKVVCDVYHISQENFTHDIILDVKDANGDLVGLLDAHLEYMKDGKRMVATVEPLELHAVSNSQLIGWFIFGDDTGSLKSIRITFASKEAVPTTPNANAKIFVISPDQIPPELPQDTLGELLEGVKYCYKNPGDRVKFLDGTVYLCSEINATREEYATKCNPAPQDRAEACQRTMNVIKDLKAGRP